MLAVLSWWDFTSNLSCNHAANFAHRHKHHWMHGCLNVCKVNGRHMVPELFCHSSRACAVTASIRHWISASLLSAGLSLSLSIFISRSSIAASRMSTALAYYIADAFEVWSSVEGDVVDSCNKWRRVGGWQGKRTPLWDVIQTHSIYPYSSCPLQTDRHQDLKLDGHSGKFHKLLPSFRDSTPKNTFVK